MTESSSYTKSIAAPEWLRSLHFIGIGGAGMSGIALVLHSRGYQVTGSDLKPSRYTALLQNEGVDVKIGHKAVNLDHPDVVVISSAIPNHNVELQEARRRGILVVKRAQSLAWLMEAGRGIAVCGTHGKTTTTSMITRSMVDGGFDPTFLVGGELNDLGSNARHGKGDFVVCEADESDGSLLLLHPEIAVLTNVELDHHSHYLHLEDVERVFADFIGRLPDNGLLVYCGEDSRATGLALRAAGCRTCSYGFCASADYQAREVIAQDRGSSFEIWHRDAKAAVATLQVPGKHNVLNALACYATLTELGLPQPPVISALADFTGAVRRFQLKGERNGVTVVDDYAHHPTELRATLRAARDQNWSRVVAVFQPHLYSRTEYLHAEFAEALSEADVAVVTDVYGAREDPWPGVSGKLIVDDLLKMARNKPVVYLPKLASIVDYLQRITVRGDLVLTLGAGDVHRVGERFLSQPERRPPVAPGDAVYEALRALDGVRVWRDAPLGPFTTIGTGGQAGALVTVSTTQAATEVLEAVERLSVPWVCLGAGSNFLVADSGFAGVVVKLGKAFEYVEGLPSCPASGDEPLTVTVGAAASLPRLAAAAAEAGLAGLDFACGIPGTVGGAVAMNAGAYDRSMADVLVEVQLATAEGDCWLAAASLDCGYRFCNLPPRSIVCAARFKLTPGEPSAVLECHRTVLRKRRTVQPQGVRTFGSTFKNPAQGGAGRFIDAAGLKGVRHGGAEISKVHANFLVNLGDATTADVLALMSLMRGEVERSCGVVLEPEVRLIGCRFPWESPAPLAQEPPESHG